MWKLNTKYKILYLPTGEYLKWPQKMISPPGQNTYEDMIFNDPDQFFIDTLKLIKNSHNCLTINEMCMPILNEHFEPIKL